MIFDKFNRNRGIFEVLQKWQRDTAYIPTVQEAESMSTCHKNNMKYEIAGCVAGLLPGAMTLIPNWKKRIKLPTPALLAFMMLGLVGGECGSWYAVDTCMDGLVALQPERSPMCAQAFRLMATSTGADRTYYTKHYPSFAAFNDKFQVMLQQRVQKEQQQDKSGSSNSEQEQLKLK
jgi:hypothetical protein